MDTFIHSLRRWVRSFSFFITLALAFSYLIIVPRDFPYLGLSISFATLATLVFFTKQQSSAFVRTTYGFCILFCACLLLRSQEFLTFLNLVAIVFFGSLMSIYSSELGRDLGFAKFFISPFYVFLGILKIEAQFTWPGESPQKIFSRLGRMKWEKHMKSFLLSLVILMLIVPLLASANPLFSSWVSIFLKLLDLSFINELLRIDNILLWLVRVIVALVLLLVTPRFIRFSEKGKTASASLGTPLHDLVIPKIIVSIVLGAFFVSQAQLYMSDTQALKALGYTHSEYAREVFGQLSLVALIVIGLIYNDRNLKRIDKVLTYILLIESFFLGGIALKSVYDYSSTWGLTHKRLWGFTGVFWLFSTLGIFSFMHFKRQFGMFVKSIVVLSGITLLAVNILNFDYLIFHFGKSVTERGVDHMYLSTLSPDSLSYAEEFRVLNDMQVNIVDTTDALQYPGGYSAYAISQKINALQAKYSKIDLRTFNLTEFRQYLDIRRIDTKNFDEKWRIIRSSDVSHYPPAQTKHINRFDRFPLRSDLPILYPYVTYYYLTYPKSIAVSISNEALFSEARLAADIWEQAGISITTAMEPLALSALDTEAILGENTSVLPKAINLGLNTLPVFVVGKGTTSSNFIMPGRGEYLVVNEQIFTNKDGRTLAQIIGYAFGLSIIPQAQTDQSLMSGLMGNLGYFDISEVDIMKARDRARTFEARVDKE